MFILLVFLLSLTAHSSVQCMMQEDIPTEDINEQYAKVIENFKTLIDFENLEDTLKKVVFSVQRFVNPKLSLKAIYNSKIVDQWRETIYLPEKPHKMCAVGPLVAWLSKKNPENCFYINRNINDEIKKIRLQEAIELIDLAPNALKIALTSRGSVEIWNIKKAKKVFNIDLSHKKQAIITALVFYRYNKLILGMNDGSINSVTCREKKPVRSFNVSTNRSAITALATITGDEIISQDLQGIVNVLRKVTKSRLIVAQSAVNKLHFNSILSFGANNWVGSTESDVFMNIPGLRIDMNVKMPNSGSLVGKTKFNEFIMYKPKLNMNKDSGFTVCALTIGPGMIHDKISVVDRVAPVIQKSDVSQVDASYNDPIPGYLVYEETENKLWTLLAREEPTYAQLAFRLVLAEAYEQKNSKALEKLFEHEQFKSFGNYMQKLLRSEFEIDIKG